MFAIFLFVVVFSFYCWLASESRLISDQQHTEFAATKTLVPIQSTVASCVHLDNFSKTSEAHLTVAPIPDLMLQTEAQEAVPITLSPIHKEAKIALKEITEELALNNNHTKKQVLEDIAALKIRSARKVASALGIKQKANGADKSLNCLQQEIKKSLQSKPEELVIQALKLAKVCS